MIYMELGPSTSVGIGLISVGITLYALGKREPNVSRGVILNVPRVSSPIDKNLNVLTKND
uniref:Hypothetical chloroplast RF66 n=1 Tax=Huperzia lucidula TaxID=37429 RepID=Q5SCY4_HUPLU|nr:hypothetical chloroplast RF66 [Huperzia lucidula]AAT80749.1 hypothetical chloroplast RF66 [Huperzia lucidula]